MTEFSDKLIAVVCGYNEVDLLPGMLDSLEGRVDEIVFADGRYKMFPGEGGPSTDGTLDIVRDRGLTLIPSPDDGWETEHDKRTALVQHGKPGDQYLVIDADERLEGSGDLKSLYGDYKVTIRGVEGTPGLSQAVRMFMHRPDMEYRWHFGLFSKGQTPVLVGHEHLPTSLIWLSHWHHLRSPERVVADAAYEEHLVPFEASIGAYGGRL